MVDIITSKMANFHEGRKVEKEDAQIIFPFDLNGFDQNVLKNASIYLTFKRSLFTVV